MIYKICSADEWSNANEVGVYKGSKDDLRDGFIHFSTFDQVPVTLTKHFNGQSNLLLLKVDVEELDQSLLKWEVSKKGDKFPHLYGDLNLDAVISVENINK